MWFSYWLNFPRLTSHLQRNLHDKTGLEPSKLFNLVQFLIFDHNSNGLVSVDETMSMLYARYGRVRMESKLKELFGDGLEETGVLPDLQIPFTDGRQLSVALMDRQRRRRDQF